MKKIDFAKQKAFETFDYYDKKYDLPKEMTIRSLVKFVISVKRVRRSEKKTADKLDIEESVKSAKEIDEEIERFLSFFRRKPSAN